MNRLPDEMTFYPPVNGKLLRHMLAAARGRGEIDWGVDEATFQFWKANAGNAKARRRWRRRDVPNSQRPTSNMAAQCMAAWATSDGAMEKAVGEWQDALRYTERLMGVRHVDGGTAQPVNASVVLTLGGRSVDVTGQTNEEIAQAAARMINGDVL